MQQVVTSPGDQDVVRGRFPATVLVSPLEAGRFTVHRPDTRARWSLGGAELRVARMFDGERTYAAIGAELRRSDRRAASVASLRSFEERLIALGLLDAGPRPTPAARMWRRVVSLDRIDLGSYDPTPLLDAVSRRAPRAVLFGAAVCTAAGLGALGLLLTRLGPFLHGVPGTLRGWGLPGLYAVCAFSSVFHEGGHAVACRAYGVPVRQVGLGLRTLVVFAWTTPDERRWDGLRRSRQLVTIAAGPLGSLLFAGIGAALWLAPLGAPADALGTLVVLAGTVCLLPTLSPSFDGDAYLILTGVCGRPNLRSRSYAHVRSLLSGMGRAETPRARIRWPYLAFAVTTVAGRLATAVLVGWLFWVCTLRPLWIGH